MDRIILLGPFLGPLTFYPFPKIQWLLYFDFCLSFKVWENHYTMQVLTEPRGFLLQSQILNLEKKHTRRKRYPLMRILDKLDYGLNLS